MTPPGRAISRRSPQASPPNFVDYAGTSEPTPPPSPPILFPLSQSNRRTPCLVRFGRRTMKPMTPEGHRRAELFQPPLLTYTARNRASRGSSRVRRPLLHAVRHLTVAKSPRNLAVVHIQNRSSSPATRGQTPVSLWSTQI
jgi:hypothetical protein